MKSITVKQVAAFCGATANIDGEILKISTDSRDIDAN